jgi:signal transduction histidine kinase
VPSLEREPVDVAELATEVVERARPRAGDRQMSLSVEGQATVLGDRDRLKQMIANLIENAVRYTPRSGRVDVSITVRSGDAGVQHSGRAGRSSHARDAGASTDMVLLTVADTGIGISPTDLPHLFERFYRADKARSRAHGGSGLGLSIAQYIAQAHGGTIQACSDGIGRGSTFVVRLPRLVDDRAGKDDASSAAPLSVAASLR